MSDLAVRLSGNGQHATITDLVSDLRLKDVDPGGFGGASFSFKRPINATDLAPFSQVAIFDVETGECVGGGRLLDPGKSARPGEEIWSMTVLGEGIASMQEQQRPYYLIDSGDDAWQAAYRTSKKTTWSKGLIPNGSTEGWLMNITGEPVNPTWKCDLRSYGIYNAGQLVGGYHYTHREGRNSSNNKTQAFASNLATTGFVITHDQSWTTSDVTVSATIGANWTIFDGVDNVFIRYTRDASPLTGISADDEWCHVSAMSVLALRSGRSGSYDMNPASYANPYVLAHEAFVDIFSRAPSIDVANAEIATGTFQFKNLAWPTGMTPYGAAEEILKSEQGLTWAVWEQQSNGKWRGELRQRDAERVRYELTPDDGFEQAADNTQILRSVFVYGRTAGGNHIAREVLQPPNSPPLTAEVRAIRTIELPNQTFDSLDANARGWTEIKDSRLAASQASMTVARKVYDNFTGRWIKPFHIKPGYLCRVRGVRPQVDTLNPTTIPDATTFRIVTKEYSSSTMSASLQLNAYEPDESRALAGLVKAS